MDADPSTVIRSNGLFRLLDTEAGAVTVVAPSDLSSWLSFAQPGGVFLGSTGSQLLVIRSALSPQRLAIELATPLAPEPVSLQLVDQNGTSVPTDLTATGTDVPVVAPNYTETFTIKPGEGMVDSHPQIQLLGVSSEP